MFAPTSRRTSEPLPAIHGKEPFFTASRPLIPVSRPVNAVSATENPISRPADNDTASQNHSTTLRSVHRYRRQNLTRHQLHQPAGRAHRPRRHCGRQQRGHARRPSHDSGGRQSGQIHQEDRNEKRRNKSVQNLSGTLRPRNCPQPRSRNHRFGTGAVTHETDAQENPAMRTHIKLYYAKRLTCPLLCRQPECEPRPLQI